MKKFSLTLATAALVTACGGGSGVPSSTGTSTAPPPASASQAANSSTAPLAPMPVTPANAVKISSGAVNQGGSAAVWDITFKAAVDLTISGQLNKFWVSAAAPGGHTTIAGGQNTIVFRPGTETTVNVSGSANVFYLVEGSPLTIEGTGAASSTIIYYKP